MLSSSSPPTRGRLVSVDILRGLAALAVVIGHIPFAVETASPVGALLSAGLRGGRMGVPVFLVLSGFCIHLANARALARGAPFPSDWVGFWKRRSWRLYPPYLAAILVTLVLYGIAGSAAFPGEEQITAWPGDLLVHLLMLHNLFALFCFGLGNGPFWTLGLEEQLYLLYIPFLAVRRARTLGTILALTLLVTLGWQFGWRFFFGPDDGGTFPTFGPAPFALGRWLKWPFGFWFSWALGAAAAEASTGAIRLHGWCQRRRLVILLVGIGLATSHATINCLGLPREGPPWETALLGVLSSFSDLSFAGAGFVLLNRWVRLEAEGRFQGWFANRVAGLGVMSYSLYLTHLPVIRLLVLFIPATGIAGGLLRISLLAPVCVAFGACFFWLVERHFLNRSSPGSPSRTRPPAIPASRRTPQPEPVRESVVPAGIG